LLPKRTRGIRRVNSSPTAGERRADVVRLGSESLCALAWRLQKPPHQAALCANIATPAPRQSGHCARAPSRDGEERRSERTVCLLLKRRRGIRRVNFLPTPSERRADVVRLGSERLCALAWRLQKPPHQALLRANIVTPSARQSRHCARARRPSRDGEERAGVTLLGSEKLRIRAWRWQNPWHQLAFCTGILRPSRAQSGHTLAPRGVRERPRPPPASLF